MAYDYSDSAADLVISNRDYADANPQPARSSWRDSSAASGLRSAGSSLSKSGQGMIDSARSQAAANANRSTALPSYRKGGKVRKTGPARLHKGELVVPRKKARKVEKMMRRKRGRGM